MCGLRLWPTFIEPFVGVNNFWIRRLSHPDFPYWSRPGLPIGIPVISFVEFLEMLRNIAHLMNFVVDIGDMGSYGENVFYGDSNLNRSSNFVEYRING